MKPHEFNPSVSRMEMATDPVVFQILLGFGLRRATGGRMALVLVGKGLVFWG